MNQSYNLNDKQDSHEIQSLNIIERFKEIHYRRYSDMPAQIFDAPQNLSREPSK